MSNSFLSDLVPGCKLSVFSNRAPRPATVLALRNNQMLIEYRFPRGTTALLCFTLGESEEGEIWWGRNKQYERLSLDWLQAIRDAGVDWIGNPKMCGHAQGPVPSAQLMLQQRQFRHFWYSGADPQLRARIKKQREWKEDTSRSNSWSEVAARAIFLWILSSMANEPEVLHARLLTLSCHRHATVRTVVSVAVDTQEWFIDPTRIMTKEKFLQRWPALTCFEEVPSGEVARDPQEGGIPYARELSEEIASSLLEKVGPFSRGLLFPTNMRRDSITTANLLLDSRGTRDAA